MLVKVANREFRMKREEFLELIQKAKEQLDKGIVAIERDGVGEITVISCKSITELKEKKQSLKRCGYKVYAKY